MSHQGNKKTVLLISSLLVACLSLLAFSPACIAEKIHPLTIENQTSQILQIYVGVGDMKDYTVKRYQQIGIVPANKTATIRDSGIVPNFSFDSLIEAKTDTDAVLFSQWYTTDELEEIGWKIVITPLSGG
jgi:hypothetical protein